MTEQPGTVRFDPDAAAAYGTSAARVVELLTTAAGHADAAASVDLSRALGLAGAGFAAAFTTAVVSQAETVRLAADLHRGFAATVAAAGAALAQVDDDTAAALGAAAGEVVA